MLGHFWPWQVYTNAFCLIVAVPVFIKGMELIGVTSALISALQQSITNAKLSATFGPLIVAAVCGSGGVAALAFNAVLTPRAFELALALPSLVRKPILPAH